VRTVETAEIDVADLAHGVDVHHRDSIIPELVLGHPEDTVDADVEKLAILGENGLVWERPDANAGYLLSLFRVEPDGSRDLLDYRQLRTRIGSGGIAAAEKQWNGNTRGYP
jgi:hypothetical protein